MVGIPLNYILFKFINNTFYNDVVILPIIKEVMTEVFEDADKLPLTIISSFQDMSSREDISNKSSYYYPVKHIQEDIAKGALPLSLNEFKLARYGVVGLKVDSTITAKQFLTSAAHEYIAAAHCVLEEDIESDSMIIGAKKRAGYDLAEKLAEKLCKIPKIAEMLADFDEDLRKN